MRLALVNGVRREATKGESGECPLCGGPMIARCGDVRVHHWAHNKGRMCDKWWEPETQWHRQWKDQFDVSWQEVIVHDEATGKDHIADIRTEHGLVIEFQHSYIASEERRKRERHYKDVVWVVDGTRLERDYKRFEKGRELFERVDHKNLFRVNSLQAVFPRNWIDSAFPCLFDFMGFKSERESQEEQMLYCILPVKDEEYSLVAGVTKTAFLKNVKSGEWSSRIKRFVDEVKRRNQPKLEIISILKVVSKDLNRLLPIRKGNNIAQPFCKIYKDYKRLRRN